MDDNSIPIQVLRAAENKILAEIEEKTKNEHNQLRQIREAIDTLMGANKAKPEIVVLGEKPFRSILSNHPRQVNVRTRSRKGGKSGSKVSLLEAAVGAIIKTNRFQHKRDLEAITGIDNVTSHLSNARSKGKKDLVSFSPTQSNNQTVWGFSYWLDDSGKPLPEHMYDAKILEYK